MLAGQHPFAGLDRRALMAAHLHERPADPNVDLPPAVRALLRRCLAKSPQLRPRDASAFRQLLDQAWAPDGAAQSDTSATLGHGSDTTLSLVTPQADRAVLAGRFGMPPVPVTAKVKLDRRKARSVALNDKRPRSTASWVASLQMVLFHPGDLALASGAPDLRRAYLDRILEQMDPTYAKTLAAYTKALRSRNRLLKAEEVDRLVADQGVFVMEEPELVLDRPYDEWLHILLPGEADDARDQA